MFETIVGNDTIKGILTKSITNKTISHSYLFVGIKGIGKKRFGTELAKNVLCLNNGQNDSCKSCIEFDSENHPDFLCIKPDENSIKIEQIRFLQKKIQEKPILSSKKVYIIDDADTMTQEAQNCLLKTLEEPPEYVLIILIGENENSFLSTIKSRCMIIHFQPIQNVQMKNYLENNYGFTNITDNQLDMFQGSIGKAILLKDKLEEYKEIEKMIQDLNKKDLIDIMKYTELLYSTKEEVYEILEYMNIILLNKAKDNYLYTNCIKIVENTKKRLKQNANYDMCIDNLLFNMWEELSFKS